MKTKLSETWELTDGEHKINVEVVIQDPIVTGEVKWDAQTALTITTASHQNRFNLTLSDPEVVRAIGKLLLEAADLVERKE